MNVRRTDDREGAEAYLFQPYRGHCYGYVHLGRTDPDDDDTIRRINLMQLGAGRSAESVGDVHVIWLAARLGAAGICVVGDYRGAGVYHEAQAGVGRRPWGWNIEVRAEAVRVIPEERRVSLDGVPLRQGNMWYAKDARDDVTRRAAKAQLSRLGVSLVKTQGRASKRAG
jgi:hypothetical protein